MNNKQEELYKILLLPIEKQKMDSYKIEEKVIYSGTKYGTKFDPDMSNIAIKFYSVIYGIEEEKLLSKSEGFIKGDTMNTSSPYYKPPRELTEQWDVDKHCLANFWILPMNIGRTPVRYLSEEQKLYCKHSKKSRIHDYMDVFLEFLKDHIDDYFCEYNKYFDELKVSKENFVDEFSQAHFLKNGYYEINIVKEKEIDKTTLRNGYDLWRNAIEERAREIATSDKWEELYDEFVNKQKSRIDLP